MAIVVSRRPSDSSLMTPDPWLRRIGEDGHAAAADQAVVPAVVVVEAKGEDLAATLGIGQQSQSALLDFGLNAAASQGPLLAAVGEDEHGGAGLLGGRAARLDHGAENARPASL